MKSVEIGCVQYLNARPLIYGCPEEIYFDHPSKLAEMLAGGMLDVALVPTFELLSNPGYKAVDGVSISSLGTVFSVFLAYRGELKEVRKISLDISSLSSGNLLRCLLAEYHDMRPDYVRSDECDDPDMPRLLIGNHAIEFRQAKGDEYNYLDLGSEWFEKTSLPFVFALWLIRPGVLFPEAVADDLRRMKADGLAHLDEIIRHESDADPEFRQQYLRQHIRYDLGEPEKKGIRKFHELALKHGLLTNNECCLNFV